MPRRKTASSRCPSSTLIVALRQSDTSTPITIAAPCRTWAHDEAEVLRARFSVLGSFGSGSLTSVRVGDPNRALAALQRRHVFAGPQNGTEPVGTRIANRVELPYFLLDVVCDPSNSHGSIVIHRIGRTRIAIIRETHAAAVCHNEPSQPTNEGSMYVAIYDRLGVQRAKHGDQFRIRCVDQRCPPQ